MPRNTPNPTRNPPRDGKLRPVSTPPEVIDPRWLLKAFAVVLSIAVVCGYMALCLLFYLGQWQIVLHPARTGSNPAPVVNASAEFLRFAPDDSAVPQLAGWWIPAALGGKYAGMTLLYLPGGDGSLADCAASLTALHSLGINLFALDYRGYGQSAGTHPSYKSMTDDAQAAWDYLRTSRNLPEQRIVPYGVGVGASLAVALSIAHPQAAVIILESPHGDLEKTLGRDARSSMVPARLLFHENFPLAAPLASLRTPKLLLTPDTAPTEFHEAADPKMTVEFKAPPGAKLDPAQTLPSITRFLDQYLTPAPVTQLLPPPAVTHR